MSQMTCGEFVNVVHGLVRMEVLDVALREDALEHAVRCGRCSEIMTEARFLADATEAAAIATRCLQTPPQVSAALLVELQNRRERMAWWRNVQWAAAGAMAAVLVVALWAASIHVKSPTVSGPRRVPQISGPVEAVKSVQSPPDASHVTNPQASADSVNVAAAAVVSTNPVATDNLSASAGTVDTAAGDFVSVPYTEEIGPDDEAMVVRVQLTRESLAQLGFPVDQVHGSDWVRADVLVGQDGWPRGVRLVR